MPLAKEFKRRMVVAIDGAPCMIEQVQVQTPSARGASTLYKVRARNLKTGAKVEKMFRGTDMVGQPQFEKRSVQYLYRDPGHFYFMDQADFNQYVIPAGDMGDEADYLVENLEGVTALVVNDQVIGIEIPDTVALQVRDTAPGVRGNSATGRTKAATLETGKTVQVPEYLEPGEMIRIDTRTGEFVGRVK